MLRDVAQLGSAPALGAGCRRFKSCHPDFYSIHTSSLKFFHRQSPDGLPHHLLIIHKRDTGALMSEDAPHHRQGASAIHHAQPDQTIFIPEQ
jgi:hypothetical protein